MAFIVFIMLMLFPFNPVLFLSRVFFITLGAGVFTPVLWRRCDDSDKGTCPRFLGSNCLRN